MPQDYTRDGPDAFAGGDNAGNAEPGPFAGFEAEHIFIGDDSLRSEHEPETVSTRIRIKNRARGIATELILYREGFLRVIEETGRERKKDHTLELRFIDPEPQITRRTAAGWLWCALGAAAAAFGGTYLMRNAMLSDYGFAATTMLMTVSTLAFLAFVYRCEERIRFFTSSGRAEVVNLTSSLGCIGKLRRGSRLIRKSIVGASGNPAMHDSRYLRAEMQAHYKLRESGVISEEACANGTARILARFG